MSTPIDKLVSDAVTCLSCDAPFGACDCSPQTEDGAIPIATHGGTLRFAGVTLRVYVLSDGQRVIDAEDFEREFLEGIDGL